MKLIALWHPVLFNFTAGYYRMLITITTTIFGNQVCYYRTIDDEKIKIPNSTPPYSTIFC